MVTASKIQAEATFVRTTKECYRYDIEDRNEKNIPFASIYVRKEHFPTDLPPATITVEVKL